MLYFLSQSAILQKLPENHYIYHYIYACVYIYITIYIFMLEDGFENRNLAVLAQFDPILF